MLINFIGCPQSGKTTTAAKLYSTLKEMGIPSEFIPEQARMAIIEKRVERRLDVHEQVLLSSKDQLGILKRQFDIEELFLNSCGNDMVIISDSSALNTLLYLNDKDYNDSKDLPFLKERLKRKDVHYFLCDPVVWVNSKDPNRIHDKKQSIEFNDKILKRVLPIMIEPATLLSGTIPSRNDQAYSKLMKILVGV